jgi:hypothetical protein
MRDETAGEEPKNLISAWELSLAREKSMAEQRELQSAIEQKDRRFYRISFLLTLIILLLVILIFYISRRSQAVKNQALLYEQKIKHDLELDSKELIAESVRNVSVQAAKSSMYADVKRIIEKLPKTNQKLFDKFFQSEHMFGEDLVLEEFDKRFVGVYEDFYQGIQQIAPDLTPIELRVCAFIRLNCSTKEIAILMSRSVGRIENIRIAIRKKLKLAKGDDLQQFLLKF